MSVGTLHRRFRDEIGTTPLGWLTAQRVALACRLIEQGHQLWTWLRTDPGSVRLRICGVCSASIWA